MLKLRKRFHFQASDLRLRILMVALLQQIGRVFYTDNTGIITLPIKLTYGKYQLIEVNAGTGYVLDSTPIDFEVNGENKTIELVKYNKPQKATITVTKQAISSHQ